jgi:uncharacterized membrane protein
MRIIRDNQRLPKEVLHVLAAGGWISVLYLAYVVGMDSWERTMFSITALRQGLPDMDPFNQRYVDNAVLTLFHTIPAVLFAVLGPLQFMSPIRQRAPRIHRMTGRIFLPIAILCGGAALVIGFRFPMWGWSVNQGISFAMAAFMIFAFSKAYLHVRARRFHLHREWMIRGFATGLSVALFRVLLVDILLPNGVEFTQAWNIVTAISTPLMLGAAELWIRVTRPKRLKNVVSDVAPATAQ